MKTNIRLKVLLKEGDSYSFKIIFLMELDRYLDKKIQIILIQGFTYVGVVVDCDKDSLTILDKTNKIVQIRESSIELIKEVQA